MFGHEVAVFAGDEEGADAEICGKRRSLLGKGEAFLKILEVRRAHCV